MTLDGSRELRGSRNSHTKVPKTRGYMERILWPHYAVENSNRLSVSIRSERKNTFPIQMLISFGAKDLENPVLARQWEAKANKGDRLNFSNACARLSL